MEPVTLTSNSRVEGKHGSTFVPIINKESARGSVTLDKLSTTF